MKVLTALAFVYIPLNLATPIFGTSLQKLNASGQPVRVFIITAVLDIASASWLRVDQVNHCAMQGKVETKIEPHDRTELIPERDSSCSGGLSIMAIPPGCESQGLRPHIRRQSP